MHRTPHISLAYVDTHYWCCQRDVTNMTSVFCGHGHLTTAYGECSSLSLTILFSTMFSDTGEYRAQGGGGRPTFVIKNSN